MKQKKNTFILSIIVVTLNHKKGLIRTLNSIKKQSFKNDIEVIVIDGKSSDGTHNVIIKNKKVINNFIIEKDNGIYNAMNKGIMMSRGKWIIFLNSGDSFAKKNIKKIIKDYLNKTFKRDVIFGNTILNYGFHKYIKKGRDFCDDQIEMPFCHQSVFVKSKILKKFKFSENFKLSSDFDFFNKIYHKKYNFLKINKIISIVETGGLADRNRFKVLSENLRIKFKYNKNKKFIFNYLILILYTSLSNGIKRVFPQFLTKKITRLKFNQCS